MKNQKEHPLTAPLTEIYVRNCKNIGCTITPEGDDIWSNFINNQGASRTTADFNKSLAFVTDQTIKLEFRVRMLWIRLSFKQTLGPVYTLEDEYPYCDIIGSLLIGDLRRFALNAFCDIRKLLQDFSLSQLDKQEKRILDNVINWENSNLIDLIPKLYEDEAEQILKGFVLIHPYVRYKTHECIWHELDKFFAQDLTELVKIKMAGLVEKAIDESPIEEKQKLLELYSNSVNMVLYGLCSNEFLTNRLAFIFDNMPNDRANSIFEVRHLPKQLEILESTRHHKLAHALARHVILSPKLMAYSNAFWNEASYTQLIRKYEFDEEICQQLIKYGLKYKAKKKEEDKDKSATKSSQQRLMDTMRQ